MNNHKLTLATVNFNTPKYIEVLCSSLYKSNPWFNGVVHVYDNSDKTPLTPGQYAGYFVHNVDTSLYSEFNSMPRVNDPGWRNYASAKHAKSLQYIIDSTQTDFLMILDSDIIFTDSFERLFNIFVKSNSVMCGYIRKPVGYSERIAPWCTLLNLRLMRQLQLKYYDETRILYVNGNMKDDTGASILADCRESNYPIIELPQDNMFYFHFKGGSYSDPVVVNKWLLKLQAYWK
jgi:hypothetical protein